MDKKIIDIVIGNDIEIDIDNYCRLLPIPIDELRDVLDVAIGEGATHIEIECSKDYDGDYEGAIIRTIQQREETDDEYNKRMIKDKMNKEAVASRVEYGERRELERLKAKYSDT